MVNAIEPIIAKSRPDHPEHAAAFTEDWVRGACADLTGEVLGPVDGASADLMGYYALYDPPNDEQHQWLLGLIGARGHAAIAAAYQKAQALSYKGPAADKAKRSLEVGA